MDVAASLAPLCGRPVADSGLLGLRVYASAPWRSELREAIGPVMAGRYPITLAYVPAALIGFMVFTLGTLCYRVASVDPPVASWPPVTIVFAGRN